MMKYTVIFEIKENVTFKKKVCCLYKMEIPSTNFTCGRLRHAIRCRTPALKGLRAPPNAKIKAKAHRSSCVETVLSVPFKSGVQST